MLELTIEKLLEKFRAGDRRACGQLISFIENNSKAAVQILNEIYPLIGRAYRIGITGPPGAGKSTLVEKLALECRKRGQTVGIVAVDPSSPFSGGAVLGDRVRMSALFTDPKVFIRSMATRGSLGGLAGRTKEVCDILDAFGMDFLLIETVGVGQMELDIAEAADTTVVVLVPESGDAIQTLKAGLMEIGEIYCVNKSDREGADRMVLEIEMMLELKPKNDGWLPPVIKTVATKGNGVTALFDEIERHRRYLTSSAILVERRRKAIKTEIERLIVERLRQNIYQQKEIEKLLDQLTREVVDKKLTPYQAAERIITLVLPELGQIYRFASGQDNREV
ncbi:MAG: methylmalonyl Co-A mutase-associated GTPase MeaB [candidate division WOR-3 bacterium]